MQTDNEDIILIYLENSLTKKINKLVHKDKPEYLPEINQYISKEEIKNLITLNGV